jgi:hypothetical protein
MLECRVSMLEEFRVREEGDLPLIKPKLHDITIDRDTEAFAEATN